MRFLCPAAVFLACDVVFIIVMIIIVMIIVVVVVVLHTCAIVLSPFFFLFKLSTASLLRFAPYISRSSMDSNRKSSSVSSSEMPPYC